MGHGFKHGASGVPLNFKIVGGTTEPTNPKENMIWVNTDQKITEWAFAAENPYVHTSENLYTNVGAKTGYYLNASGEEIAGTNSKEITGNIMLPEGTTSVTVVASITASTETSHAFYDVEGKLISTVLRKTGTVEYDVPSGAASIRISVRSDDPGSLVATYIASKEGTWKISSTAGEIVGTAGGITFTKKNAGKAIFAFARNQDYTIPLLVSDNKDAAVLIGADGYEYEAFAFTYKGKLYYNTYPGLGIDLWDTASPKMKWTIDPDAIKKYLVEILEGNKPNSVPEGTVWFKTVEESVVGFNALKKNRVMVHPVSAKQYQSGAFADVTAKSYQGGAWVDWIRYLYHEGDEYTGITGGWTSDGWTAGTETVVAATKHNTYILLGESTTERSRHITAVEKKLSFTENTKAVCVLAETVKTSDGCFNIRLTSETSKDNPVATILTNGTVGETETFRLDVSGVSPGEYYVMLDCYTSNAMTRQAKIYSIWLE